MEHGITNEEWMRAAYDVLKEGIDLMPLEQLTRWDGVRALIESFPLRDEKPVVDRHVDQRRWLQQ